MDSATRAVADALFKGIQAEIDGHSLYLMAAEVTQDTKGKEMLTLLADEELLHVQFLSTQYRLGFSSSWGRSASTGRRRRRPQIPSSRASTPSWPNGNRATTTPSCASRRRSRMVTGRPGGSPPSTDAARGFWNIRNVLAGSS